MNVLILSKTRAGSRFCVGGLAANGTSLRLLTPQDDHQPSNTPLDVGEIWDLTYIPTSTPWDPPHVENVHVTAQQYVGKQPNLAAHLLQRVHPWQGGPGVLYGGLLGFTGNGSGYVSRDAVPPVSTGFWLPDADLTYQNEYYIYGGGWPPRRLKYVGAATALPVIPANTLVRVSLATWWPTDDHEREPRCYLQLSGWYV